MGQEPSRERMPRAVGDHLLSPGLELNDLSGRLEEGTHVAKFGDGQGVVEDDRSD